MTHMCTSYICTNKEMSMNEYIYIYMRSDSISILKCRISWNYDSVNIVFSSRISMYIYIEDW